MEELKGPCIKGKHIRRTYIRKFGPLPDGIWVLHKCDNPDCRNWNHVFLGTPSDNTQDSIKKGRFITDKRLKHHSEETKKALSLAKKKVSDEQILYIKNSGKSNHELAKELGVSHFTVRNLKSKARRIS